MHFRFTSFFIAMILLITGCKKDDFISGTHERLIKINLDNQYVSANKIDSAFLITIFTGTSTKIKLDVKDNSIEKRLSSFSQANGKLIVQLYTSTKYEAHSLQFEKEIEVNLSAPEALVLNGPSSLSDLSWKPRIILDYQGIDLRQTAIVALRPSDPYFEIQHLPQRWDKRISVYRGFYKGNYITKVYGKTWDRNNNVSGNQVNRDYFLNLQEEVKLLDWDKMAIEVAFYLTENTISELSFVYNK